MDLCNSDSGVVAVASAGFVVVVLGSILLFVPTKLINYGHFALFMVACRQPFIPS
jgi:hypothetical protein